VGLYIGYKIVNTFDLYKKKFKYVAISSTANLTNLLLFVTYMYWSNLQLYLSTSFYLVYKLQ